jgi:hypothetical protein
VKQAGIKTLSTTSPGIELCLTYSNHQFAHKPRGQTACTLGHQDVHTCDQNALDVTAHTCPTVDVELMAHLSLAKPLSQPKREQTVTSSTNNPIQPQQGHNLGPWYLRTQQEHSLGSWQRGTTGTQCEALVLAHQRKTALQEPAFAYPPSHLAAAHAAGAANGWF